MYLIHAHLRAADPAPLPEDAGEWLRVSASAEERIEHVSVHAGAGPYPVLGVYLTADRLDEAERRTAQAVRRVLAARDALSGWTLVRAEAPLMVPGFHDRGFHDSGFHEPGFHDPGDLSGLPTTGSGRAGRNRPGPDPSS